MLTYSLISPFFSLPLKILELKKWMGDLSRRPFLLCCAYYFNPVHEKGLTTSTCCCVCCPGSSSSPYVRSIEYEESLRQLTSFIRKWKRIARGRPGGRRKKKLPKPEHIPALYTIGRFFLSHRHSHVRRPMARGSTPENVLLIFSTPFFLHPKPFGMW